MSEYVRRRALVHFLSPEDGGRETLPKVNVYSPTVEVDGQAWSVRIEFDSRSSYMVTPAWISFPVSLRDVPLTGEYDLREGSRVVATAFLID